MKLSIFSLKISSFLIYSLTFGQTLNNQSIWKEYAFLENRLPYFEWNRDNTITFYGKKTITISSKTGDTLSINNQKPNTISKNNIELVTTNKKYIYRHSYKANYLVINKKDTTNLHHQLQQSATFSPTGKFISYVSDNNLFIYDTQNKKTYSQLTQDGKKNTIINGISDWVHEEEFGFTKAYWWSNNEQYIAYLKFNESEVPTFTLTKQTSSNYPKTEIYKYPKVGEKNSTISLWIYDLKHKKNIKICDNTEDEYILNPTWSNEVLYFQTLDRKQQHLKLISYKNDTFDTIYQESSNTYINITPLFFNNQHLILQSEKTGFNHIYKLDLDSRKLHQLTSGTSPISKIITIKNNDIYAQQKTDRGLNSIVFKINSSTKQITSLSPPIGNYDLYVSPYNNAHILKQSTINEAPEYTLINIEKELLTLTTLVDNSHLSNFFRQNSTFPKLSAISVNDTLSLNTYTILPPNFKKNKKYPLLIYVYGGPGYQTVENKWLGTTYAWHQYLAKKGYIVISIDPRGTGGKGKTFRDCTYQNLGTVESKDIITAVKNLSKQKHIDESRIGIWGWSFGGYLTTRCLLTENSPFKTGIAVAPVTDWRFYDNIYTERYMGLDDSTNTNYNVTSCLNKTDLLTSKLLLIHGTLDDNVHIQNTYQLQQKLIESNKEFDCFVYPNKNHGIYGGNTRFHLFNKITNYILKNL